MAIFLTGQSRVMIQGITGSEGRRHGTRMLAAGTRVGKTPSETAALVRDIMRTRRPHHYWPFGRKLPFFYQSDRICVFSAKRAVVRG